MVPGIEAPDLIVSLTAGALGTFEATFDEMARRLHFSQVVQTCLWFGIEQTELQFRTVEFVERKDPSIAPAVPKVDPEFKTAI